MKKSIIIAENTINTIKAEQAAGGLIRVFDLYDEEYLLSPGEFNDAECLRHTISFFSGMEGCFPHAETFDSDGLYGA